MLSRWMFHVHAKFLCNAAKSDREGEEAKSPILLSKGVYNTAFTWFSTAIGTLQGGFTELLHSISRSSLYGTDSIAWLCTFSSDFQVTHMFCMCDDTLTWLKSHNVPVQYYWDTIHSILEGYFWSSCNQQPGITIFLSNVVAVTVKFISYRNDGNIIWCSVAYKWHKQGIMYYIWMCSKCQWQMPAAKNWHLLWWAM